MPKQKGNPGSWIDLAVKTATKFGRGVYVAFREGEAEVLRPTPKERAGQSARWWEVLGVPRSASKEEIKAAYRKLMQTNHPDKAAHLSAAMQKEAGKVAQRLNEAYEQAMSQG